MLDKILSFKEKKVRYYKGEFMASSVISIGNNNFVLPINETHHAYISILEQKEYSCIEMSKSEMMATVSRYGFRRGDSIN